MPNQCGGSAPVDAGSPVSATCNGITVTNACGVCAETQCCAQVTACEASPDFVNLEYCMAQTTPALCPNAFPVPWDLGAPDQGVSSCPVDPNATCVGVTCCSALYPDAWAAWEALFNCFDNPVYPGWCVACSAPDAFPTTF